MEYSFIGVPALFAKAEAAMRAAVTESDEDLLGKQIEAESAVRSGALRGGIHIDSITSSGTEVKAINATGGESGAYAAYIHEGHRADGTHVIGAYPGGLKYMEHPLIAHAPAHRGYMQAAAEAAF